MSRPPVLRPVAGALAGLILLTLVGADAASAASPPQVTPPPAAGSPWTPPPELTPPPVALPSAEIPADLLGAAAAEGLTVEGGEVVLTLPQVVDLALRNSSATRETWAAARSAAAEVGVKRADYYPQLDLSAEVERVRQSAVGNRFSFQQTDYGPSLDLTYLLLDFGGRRAGVEEARQALIAADWAHNAAFQATVLEVETAYLGYVTAKALGEAQRTSVEAAEADLRAAEDRHQAGVATIADVLQAKTRLAQARLDLQKVEGQRWATRGALATAMGLPANLPVEVGELPAEVPVAPTAEAVEALLARAIRDRPDLLAARARASAADSKIDRIRAEGRPRLDLTGRLNRTWFDIAGSTPADNYSARLMVSYPLSTGGRHRHDVDQARADAEAAHARADDLEQQVLVEVWASYYDLATASQTVTTSGELLASAEQSADVAGGRYKAGVGSILDLLAAQSTLAGARAEAILARADWLLALARLARDTGALTARPFDALSQLAPRGDHAPDAPEVPDATDDPNGSDPKP